MSTFNTTERWGWLAKAFHWIIGLAIIGMLGFGLYIAEMLGPYEKPGPVTLHKTIGLIILGLVVLRILWRLINRRSPAMPPDSRPWERLAAHGGHLALYVLMVLMPLSGWLSVSSAPMSVTMTVLGVEIPPLTTPQDAAALLQSLGVVTADDDMEAMSQSWGFLKSVHAITGKLLILVVLGHVAAALKHHFINRDNILSRMLPFGR